MAVVESLILLVVWGLSSTLCNTRQSKRLFPLFNTGRIFGAVLGSLGASLLVDRIGTENLILVTAGTLLAASGTAGMLVGQRIRQGVPPRGVRKSQKSIFSEMKKGYQFVRGSDLIRLASLAAAMLSILNFSVALPFSKAAALQFTDEVELARFLGIFNAVSTGAAFLASFFLANRLFARFGIMLRNRMSGCELARLLHFLYKNLHRWMKH